MTLDKKVIIGLEVHVQLNTKSKLFCGCATSSTEPNSSVCEVCLGFPGSKPMLNRQAVLMAVRCAMALNCKINREFFFSRKTYFYPDLAKNYQITQYEAPIGVDGSLMISSKKVELSRVHLEEDPAALVHEQGLGSSNYSLVDYNRSGVPLVEIVTSPCLSSPSEAREFLNALSILLDYLDVFDSMDSVLKVDANISITGGERVEIKNILGFKSVEKALEVELERQKKAMHKNEKIVRETRGFDEKNLATFSLRKKETEEDYGYIFDPDLPIVYVDDSLYSELKSSIPELFEEKKKRFMSKFGLSENDAFVIASNKQFSALFEGTVRRAKVDVAARFFAREMLGILNYNNLALSDVNFEQDALGDLLELLEKGSVSEKNAKEALIKYALENVKPLDFLKKNNLLLDLSSGDVEKAVKEVLSANPSAVSDLKQGNQKAMNFILGLVMKKTQAKADAREVKKIVEVQIKKL